MNCKDSGFILKNYLPHKHQILILNDRGECLQVRILKSEIISKLRPGYQVQYHLVSGVYYNKVADIEIVNIPSLIKHLDLEFLHQVLELCILTIPIGQIAGDAFVIIKLLTTNDLYNWSVYQKRLLICCLLASVGFYPEVKSVHDYELVVKISKIDATKIDSFSNFRCDKKLDLLLINWIVNFINSDDSSRLASLFAAICQN